jgi:hypothetical protein
MSCRISKVQKDTCRVISCKIQYFIRQFIEFFLQLRLIENDLGGKVSILGVHVIGHCVENLIHILSNIEC